MLVWPSLATGVYIVGLGVISDPLELSSAIQWIYPLVCVTSEYTVLLEQMWCQGKADFGWCRSHGLLWLYKVRARVRALGHAPVLLLDGPVQTEEMDSGGCCKGKKQGL